VASVINILRMLPMTQALSGSDAPTVASLIDDVINDRNMFIIEATGLTPCSKVAHSKWTL
jgi:hypothetical protein